MTAFKTLAKIDYKSATNMLEQAIAFGKLVLSGETPDDHIDDCTEAIFYEAIRLEERLDEAVELPQPARDDVLAEVAQGRLDLYCAVLAMKMKWYSTYAAEYHLRQLDRRLKYAAKSCGLCRRVSDNWHAATGRVTPWELPDAATAFVV